MRLNYPMKRNGMYIFKKKDFDDVGEAVISEYMPGLLEYPQATDIMTFATECLFLDVEDMYITQDGSILGMIAFGDAEFTGYGLGHEEKKVNLKEGTILIDYSLMGAENRGRRRYTLAHECSHWLCHRTYHSPVNRVYELRRNGPGAVLACRSENIEGNRSSSSYSSYTEDDWEEWQADSLAATLLMPRKTFFEGFRDAMWKEGVRQDYLIKGDDIFVERSIIHHLMEVFDVSYTAAEIRMKTLGLMREYSYARHLGYGS